MAPFKSLCTHLKLFIHASNSCEFKLSTTYLNVFSHVAIHATTGTSVQWARSSRVARGAVGLLFDQYHLRDGLTRATPDAHSRQLSKPLNKILIALNDYIRFDVT